MGAEHLLQRALCAVSSAGPPISRKSFFAIASLLIACIRTTGAPLALMLGLASSATRMIFACGALFTNAKSFKKCSDALEITWTLRMRPVEVSC